MSIEYGNLCHISDYYKDSDNDGFVYGLELTDSKSFMDYECFWFKSTEKRFEFIKQHNIILKGD